VKRIERLLATMLTLTALGTAATASAHHAFATEYDIDKPVALKGTLTKIEWVNPHGWIYLDVLNPRNGEIRHWAVEFGGPNALLRRGLRKTDFPVGVTVEVHGYLAKSGPTSSCPMAETFSPAPRGRAHRRVPAGSEGVATHTAREWIASVLRGSAWGRTAPHG